MLGIFGIIVLLVPTFAVTAFAEAAMEVPYRLRENRRMRAFRKERKIF